MAYSVDVNENSVSVWAGLIVIGGIVCFCMAAALFRMADHYREILSTPPLHWLVSIAISGLVAYLLVFGI